MVRDLVEALLDDGGFGELVRHLGGLRWGCSRVLMFEGLWREEKFKKGDTGCVQDQMQLSSADTTDVAVKGCFCEHPTSAPRLACERWPELLETSSFMC